jgi:AbrB family looped-hinge helix DNA binding protein
MVIATAKMTENYQLTIPAAVRNHLGLKPGDIVSLALEAGQIVLRCAQGRWTEGSRGLGAEMWKRVGGSAAIEHERDSW